MTRARELIEAKLAEAAPDLQYVIGEVKTLQTYNNKYLKDSEQVWEKILASVPGEDYHLRAALTQLQVGMRYVEDEAPKFLRTLAAAQRKIGRSR